MNTTKQILEALQISYLHYDNYREFCFQNWVKKYAKEHAISIRALILHDGLRNWYHDQWHALVERQFIRDNSEFLRLDEPESMAEIFATYPNKIMEHYPITLIKIIKDETAAQRRISVQ